MLGKPRILSLFPNSLSKFNKKEHSYKILFNFKCIHSDTEFEITIYAHHASLYVALHVASFNAYSLENIEDIYFVEVNTKYISSSAVK